jgi:hypothetical protein
MSSNSRSTPGGGALLGLCSQQCYCSKEAAAWVAGTPINNGRVFIKCATESVSALVGDLNFSLKLRDIQDYYGKLTYLLQCGYWRWMDALSVRPTIWIGDGMRTRSHAVSSRSVHGIGPSNVGSSNDILVDKLVQISRMIWFIQLLVSLQLAISFLSFIRSLFN